MPDYSIQQVPNLNTRILLPSLNRFQKTLVAIKFSITAFLLFIHLGKLGAQPAEIGNWYIYFGNQALNEKWNWHNEVQYRNFNLGGDLEQLLLRTGIGYNLAPNNHNVLFGYAFIRAEPYITGTDNRRVIDEHRLFEQYIYRHRLSGLFITHRLRLEQRIFQDDYRNRFRYFLFLNFPLNQESMGKGALYLSTYGELFLNGERTIYDRTRLYLAAGYAVSDFIRIEVGFMSQVFSSSSREQFQLVMFNNLPF